ncbi:MAG: hypothetical protein IJO88_08475 [Oscillospiraceae bacterium]|nr:hypothetical protein [Oscillospiraceae bacterium]
MKKQAFLTAGLTLLALALVVIGSLRGEDTVVWRKAVNICMECIGLG